VIVSALASPFTPQQQQAFDAQVGKILTHYPPERRSAALIPVLHVAQGIHGWLREDAMDYCGEVVGVPATRVREVITFYTMFHLKPVGKKHVQVCVNLSCWLMGSDKLVELCQKRIGAEQFKPTDDGSASWCEVECLAACGGGPAAQINDDYFENLTVEQLEKELKK
jgi:NADH-quinone oxidoreductase subunit E